MKAKTDEEGEINQILAFSVGLIGATMVFFIVYNGGQLLHQDKILWFMAAAAFSIVALHGIRTLVNMEVGMRK